VVDLHSHILPGLDDGARTMSESLRLAADAARDGVTTIVATPHVREDYPTSAGSMERLVDEVRREIARAGIPLELMTGGEIAVATLVAMGADELRRFALGPARRYVLVEFPYHGWPLPLGAEIDRLRGLGLGAVIAHPERSADVQERPDRLADVVGTGALVQLTAASVDGRLGRTARRTAMRLLDLGLAHVVAGDAHGPGMRAAGLASAAKALGGGALAHWLTRDAPAAIVRGDDLPPRPEGRGVRSVLG
jgi:protein-tyrosine phosphatase